MAEKKTRGRIVGLIVEKPTEAEKKQSKPKPKAKEETKEE